MTVADVDEDTKNNSKYLQF